MAAECKRSCSLWDTTNSLFCVLPHKGGFCLFVFWKMQTLSASLLVCFCFLNIILFQASFLAFYQQSSRLFCRIFLTLPAQMARHLRDKGLILECTVFHFNPGKSVGCYGQVALKGFLLTERQHWDSLMLRKGIRYICQCFCFTQITNESPLKV